MAPGIETPRMQMAVMAAIVMCFVFMAVTLIAVVGGLV